jgi:hypothetical protein
VGEGWGVVDQMRRDVGWGGGRVERGISEGGWVDISVGRWGLGRSSCRGRWFECACGIGVLMGEWDRGAVGGDAGVVARGTGVVMTALLN